MNIRCASLLFVGFGLVGLTSEAYAMSAGCTAVNGFSAASAYYGPYFAITTSPLDEGEVITVSGSSASATWEFSTGNQDSIVGVPKYGISAGSFSYSFTVPAGGISQLGIFDTDYSGPGTISGLSLTCSGTSPGTPTAGTIADDPQQAMEYVGSVLALETTTMHATKIGNVVRNRLGAHSSTASPSSSASGASSSSSALQYAPSASAGVAANMAAGVVNAMANNALEQISTDRFAFWSSIGFSHLEQSVKGGSFDGNILDFSFGGDYKFNEDFLVGLSVLGSRSDLDLDFNDGSLDATEIGIAPYIGYDIANSVIFDASVGYSKLSYDLTRNNGAISGDFDARRLFISAGLSGDVALGDVTFTPGIRTIYAHEWQDSYSDSSGLAVDKNDFDLGKLTVSSEFSYDFALGDVPVTSFIRIDGNWMYDRPDGVVLTTGDVYRPDALSADVTVGVSASKGGVSTSLEISKTGLFGADLSSFGVKGSLAVAF